MTAAVYLVAWFIAILSVVIGLLFLVPICAAVCAFVLYYTIRGHYLGVKRRPRNPRGLWLERVAGAARRE